MLLLRGGEGFLIGCGAFGDAEKDSPWFFSASSFAPGKIGMSFADLGKSAAKRLEMAKREMKTNETIFRVERFIVL